MNRLPRSRSLLAIAPAFAAFLFMQACGGSDNAVAQEAADPFEGVWEGPVTLRDCTTSAVLASFQGSQVFHRGGTMSDTNSAPTSSRGPGFGTWMKSGTNYIVKFRLYTYDPTTGAPSGVVRTTRTVTVAPGGTTATSVNTSQIFDMTGALVRSGCGSDTSTHVL
ncbi:MAG: hypothetical protein ABI745_12420 [Caldimonas sp.]